MDIIFAFIQDNLTYAPIVIFLLLCLAGFNLPVSEDALLFFAGVLASQNPEHTIPLFLGIFLGAFVSDIIAYWVGRLAGPRLYDLPVISRFVNPERVDKVKRFYIRYGVVTLIVGRFIPFGVRNALFMTAGLVRMNHLVYVCVDFVVCLLSCSIYFTLYYRYGEDVIDITRRFAFVILSAFVVAVVGYLVHRKRRKQQQKHS